MKRRIVLSEMQLRKVIKNEVKRVLNEEEDKKYSQKDIENAIELARTC